MSFAFDLWSADDVRAHAAGILQRLQDGSMPCDGAWPADQIDVFRRWTESGMQPDTSLCHERDGDMNESGHDAAAQSQPQALAP